MMALIDGAVFSYLQESFARAKNWVKELQRQASPNIVIALSGNKADLANKRAVDFQVRTNKPCRDCQSFLFFAFLGNTHLLCQKLVSATPPPPPPPCIRKEGLESYCYYFALTGCPVVHRWQQLAFYGDFSKDVYECEWDIYGYWWVILDTSCISTHLRLHWCILLVSVKVTEAGWVRTFI